MDFLDRQSSSTVASITESIKQLKGLRNDLFEAYSYLVLHKHPEAESFLQKIADCSLSITDLEEKLSLLKKEKAVSPKGGQSPKGGCAQIVDHDFEAKVQVKKAALKKLEAKRLRRIERQRLQIKKALKRQGRHVPCESIGNETLAKENIVIECCNRKVEQSFQELKLKNKRFKDLLDDIILCKNIFAGIGKPEILIYPFKGYDGCWSRRLNKKDRIVYKIFPHRILILSVEGHY